MLSDEIDTKLIWLMWSILINDFKMGSNFMNIAYFNYDLYVIYR
jgi:hypothetical protein